MSCVPTNSAPARPDTVIPRRNPRADRPVDGLGHCHHPPDLPDPGRRRRRPGPPAAIGACPLGAFAGRAGAQDGRRRRRRSATRPSPPSPPRSSWPPCRRTTRPSTGSRLDARVDRPGPRLPDATTRPSPTPSSSWATTTPTPRCADAAASPRPPSTPSTAAADQNAVLAALADLEETLAATHLAAIAQLTEAVHRQDRRPRSSPSRASRPPCSPSAAAPPVDRRHPGHQHRRRAPSRPGRPPPADHHDHRRDAN